MRPAIKWSIRRINAKSEVEATVLATLRLNGRVIAEVLEPHYLSPEVYRYFTLYFQGRANSLEAAIRSVNQTYKLPRFNLTKLRREAGK